MIVYVSIYYTAWLKCNVREVEFFISILGFQTIGTLFRGLQTPQHGHNFDALQDNFKLS